MIELESRLADLGEALDLDESDDLVTAVLAGLGDAPDGVVVDSTGDAWRRPGRPRAVWLRAAAVASVAAAATLLATPASREAIADWLGLDGVGIDRQPELSVPAEAPPVDIESAPNGGAVVEVGGTAVLVDEFDVRAIDGRLDAALVSKTLAAGTGIERVDVAGNPGLWIDGEPHVVSYRSSDGTIVPQRFAGNTLLWQDGDVIRRVEGFTSLDDALAFAASLD